MIDVHPPHKAIGSTSEFFLHLFTITIGLLIAVGIEGGVEWYHHRELANEARQTMKAEIRDNAENVNAALGDIEREQKKNEANIAGLKRVQMNAKDPSNGNLSMDIGFTTKDLQDTAWRTAQATGALAYMPYAEAERLSDIYAAEQAFLKRQSQLSEDEAQMLGTIREFHLGDGKISEAAGNAMALRLGIFEGHLLALKISTRVLQNEQNAFLEGKKPIQHLSEGLTN